MSLFTKRSKSLNRKIKRPPIGSRGFRLTSAKLFASSTLTTSYGNGLAVKLPLILGGLFILTSIIVLAFSFNRLPPELPLYYSRPWGEARLTVRYNLWFLPGISIFLLGLNTVLARRIYPADPLLARILVWGGSGSVFFLTLTLIQVVRLVSS